MKKDGRFLKTIPISEFTKSAMGCHSFGTVRQLPAGKAPKLRFKPGQFFQMDDGKLYEIIYCYRCKDNPNIWYLHLEERKSFSPSQDLDKMGTILTTAGCGEVTPRIVYEMFVTHAEADRFFSDIFRNGNSWTVTTQMLLNRGKLVSSGEIVK